MSDSIQVYFAASIRGGRQDVQLYHDMIAYIKQYGTISTEHIGNAAHSINEQEFSKDQLIYLQDTNWLMHSNVVIAECTTPSLGVGYELAFAERHQIPVHVFYRPQQTQLSAMIKGDAYFHIHPYSDFSSFCAQIDEIFQSLGSR